MTETPPDSHVGPKENSKKLTVLNAVGKTARPALLGCIVAFAVVAIACSLLHSAIPMRGDDWTLVIPMMLAVLGLIDGAVYGYRLTRQNSESAEQSLRGVGATIQLQNDTLYVTGGYALSAIIGLIAGGWMGVFRYGSFGGLLIGPVIAVGSRFVFLWLVCTMPIVVSAVVKRISGLGPIIGLRISAIFLLVLAVSSIGFPFACVLRSTLTGYYSHRLWAEYLPYEIIFLPLGVMLSIISYGLWHRKRWVRRLGLPFFWFVAVASTIGVLVGLAMAAQSSGWGLPIILLTTAVTAAVAIPAWLMVWYLRGVPLDDHDATRS